jgi:predicted AAA+ superfamily ATPase
VDGKPQFDQPETEVVAQKMYVLTKLQKQGKSKAKRDKDVLSIAIGSKDHGGRVRSKSSKLTIRDGFQDDQASFRRHDHYKEEMKEVTEKVLEAKFKEFS